METEKRSMRRVDWGFFDPGGNIFRKLAKKGLLNLHVRTAIFKRRLRSLLAFGPFWTRPEVLRAISKMVKFRSLSRRGIASTFARFALQKPVALGAGPGGRRFQKATHPRIGLSRRLPPNWRYKRPAGRAS